MSSDGPPEAKRPKRDENDELADKLDTEYGGDKPQDLHIDYFYLILAEEVIGGREDLKDRLARDLAKVSKDGKWETINTTQWPQFLVGKFICKDKDLTERKREERLYSLVKKTEIAREEFIISRVCKYTTDVPEWPTADVKQMQIGKLLSTHYYNAHNENSHLDHFYIVASVSGGKGQETKAFETLSETFPTMPGQWKPVSPQEPWPLTYLGLFRKAHPEETERAREWRLHIEVQKPLKEHLIKKGFKDASLLITRACIYND